MAEIKYKVNLFLAFLWAHVKFGSRKLWFTLWYWLLQFSYWFIEFSAKKNQDYYDAQVFKLYQKVRTRKAFTFKEKIMQAGKGAPHVKILMIETEQGTIRVEIKKQDHPELFKTKK